MIKVYSIHKFRGFQLNKYDASGKATTLKVGTQDECIEELLELCGENFKALTVQDLFNAGIRVERYAS